LEAHRLKADDIRRFEKLVELLLASAPAETNIEALFRHAVALAGLEHEVWLDPPANPPRRYDSPCDVA
jgi:hypothetical protein